MYSERRDYARTCSYSATRRSSALQPFSKPDGGDLLDVDFMVPTWAPNAQPTYISVKRHSRTAIEKIKKQARKLQLVAAHI